MASMRPVQRARRLACPNFSADELKALRSLFSLLQPHFKQAWEIVQDEDADLLIINLDAGPPPARRGPAAIVGCALKPRQHARGTLHRPLRSAELLALLTEQGGTATHASDAPIGMQAFLPREHRLLGWPADFERWPLASQRILAGISRGARSSPELARVVGVPESEVAACLARLEPLGLVDSQFVPRPGGPAPEPSLSRWSGLAARVGLLLGFPR